MIKPIRSPKIPLQPELPYPFTVRETDKRGRPKTIEYHIPESEKQAFLDQHYPLGNKPKLDERRWCLHAGKNFTVKDFLVIRNDGMNFIVSPFFFDEECGGGMATDWFPERSEA